MPSTPIPLMAYDAECQPFSIDVAVLLNVSRLPCAEDVSVNFQLCVMEYS